MPTFKRRLGACVLECILFILFLNPLPAQFVIEGTGRVCRPGFFETGNECKKCPPNTFSTTENAVKCEKCPPLQTSGENRKSCRTCKVGQFFLEQAMQPCKPCPINTYSNVKNVTQCTPCPSGKISPAGSIKEAFCIVCPPGTFIQRTRGRTILRCMPCPLGMTSKRNSLECEKCPPGTFSDRFSGGICLECRSGTSSPKSGREKCTSCPLGQYQNERGAIRCKICPRGSVAKKPGQKQCRATCDPAAPGCISCERGQGYNSVTRRCETCPPGTINVVRTSTPCIPCPPGDSAENRLRTKCACKPGERVRKDGRCETCRSGFTNEDGKKCMCGIMESEVEDDCTCPPRTKPSKSNKRCVPCDPERDFECVDCGIDAIFNRRANRCETCPLNTFKDFAGKRCRRCPGELIRKAENPSCRCPKPGYGVIDGKCTPCPPGTFGDPNLAVFGRRCVRCYRGEANDKFGATKCMRCPVRNQPRGRGNIQCLPECPQGASRDFFNKKCKCNFRLVSTGEGDTLKCTACPRNEVARGSECVCPSGIFTGPNNSICAKCGRNEEGSSGRCQCKSGTVKLKGGCRECPAGTFEENGKCKRCPPGEVSKAGKIYCSTCAEGTDFVAGNIPRCLPPCAPRSFRNTKGKCDSCKVGQRVLNGTCIECINSVSVGGNMGFCERCPDGKVPNKMKRACIDP